MGYPISTDVRELFKRQNRQVVRITMYSVSGDEEEITLTEANVAEGGLNIDRYSVTGSSLELGTAVAAEMSLTLDNKSGEFNGIPFEGADMVVEIGTKDWADPDDTMHYVPMGRFTVDNSPRKLSTINISALDRMVLFDKACDWGTTSFPMTVEALLADICTKCNVPRDSGTTTGLTNGSYMIQSAPEGESLTYRQVLIWICELTGTCAYIDWDGKLRLAWYGGLSSATISESDRFSSDIADENAVLHSVQILTETETISRTVGNSGFDFIIEGNTLLSDGLETVLNNLATRFGLNGGTPIAYRPVSTTIKPLVDLWPMDTITVTRGDESYTAFVTNITFGLNRSMKVASLGITKQESGYASANPLTKREQTIITAINRANNETLNSRLQSVLQFNEIIAGSLGLHTTAIPQDDGSALLYYHSNPVLENSMEGDSIYTFTAQGFAWTKSGWNQGNPVWQYGFTADGNAIFNFISANGIHVEKPGVEYSTSITPTGFELMYRSMSLFAAEADKCRIRNLEVGTYLKIGGIKIVPYPVIGEEQLGADIYFDQ